MNKIVRVVKMKSFWQIEFHEKINFSYLVSNKISSLNNFNLNLNYLLKKIETPFES